MQPGAKTIQQVRHLTPQHVMMYSQQQARLQGQPLKLQPGQQAKMIPRPGVPGGPGAHPGPGQTGRGDAHTSSQGEEKI